MPSRLGFFALGVGVLLSSGGCYREAPPESAAASRRSPRAGRATRGPRPPPPGSDEASLERVYSSREPIAVRRGKATYYGDSLAGHRTANGEVYDPRAFTAANRDLPFGSVVRVVRIDRGLAVTVRITDRGPFGHADRIIDLSRAAATRLDMIRRGVVEVRLEILDYGPR